MSSSLFPRLSLALLFVPAVFAQIGDRADKPGVVQKSLVPADQIPPAPVLTPAQALQSFKVAPGYKVEIAAAEPHVQEPVAITFGPDGRMWVVEMRGYMPDLDGNGEDLPTGRVVVLTDRDGDGRFEDSKIFIDELVMPRAIALVADGVLVGAPPELAFWRDTDGDGKADKKEIVATDYGVRVDPKRPHLANPERAPNSLTWAYDNWIYSTAYTRKFRYVKGAWETGTTIFRGQWGLTQDDYGHFYHGSNSDHLRVDVIFSDYLQRNPNYARLAGTNVNAAENQLVWPIRVNPGINRGYRPEMLRNGRLKEFTAAGGQWIYRGDLMPEMYGNHFVAEPSANFVRRSVLTYENGSVQGRNAYEQQEFLASTDERFRPVNFSTGPDGALYVVDLYRGVLQHRISLTSYLRKQSEDRKLDQGLHLGRIYRIVPADRPAPRATQLAPLTSAQWVGKLEHSNAFWRETAQRTLVERPDPALVPAIRTIALKSALPAGRVQALWTLDGIGALDRAAVVAALEHADPVVRVSGIRLSERFLAGEGRADVVSRLLALAQGPSARVQLQAVLALGQLKDPKIDRDLAVIARLNPRNPYLRDAFYSGLAGRELSLLEALAADPAWNAGDEEANKLLSGLARGVFGSRDATAVGRVLALAGTTVGAGGGARAVALLDGLTPTVGASRRPLPLTQAPAGWAELEKNPAAKTRLARLTDVVVWPGKPGVTATAAVTPLTKEQQARFDAGKALFAGVCAACHQLNGRGLDGLAPPLLDSEWILGSHERPVRIVLHGVRGPITVLGRVHTGDMPGFGGALDDLQISSILTYLRREWGHTASPVDPEQVKAIRAATAGHTDAWSPEELNAFR
ncbi:MAG: c-type cytochrome [Opitutaceae bacterium]|nr:c-type cytochrome [Opitutaceae bacterium]